MNGQPSPRPSLDPLCFPLRGSQLIEASAGTGKTFTIAMLYVRLVLGHGGEQAAVRGPLMPPEILVVTFTEAATRELRDRIRARLAEAAKGFRQAATPALADPLLEALRASYPPAEWAACARRLELAAEWMDEAAVSTIHGWCNRMLREHAFDSQMPFTQQLDTDTRELEAEVVRDYWRTFYYPLPATSIAWITAQWASPADLAKALQPLRRHVGLLPESAEPGDLLARSLAERTRRLTALKAPWPNWVNELQALLADARACKAFNGNKLRAASVDNWCAALREWAETEAEWPALTDSAWSRLTPDGIADAWNSDTPPEHPAFAALRDLPAALNALPTPTTDLLCHAARWVEDTLAATLKQRARIRFDDLLTRLAQALEGPHGERLASLIRTQFPVALIDEFQDTDPVQYRIFARVYGMAEAPTDSALILIGDPKQAIYAFRGADIYTYLTARRAVGERHHTLGTNYRSTRAMVDATNHWFHWRERQPDSPGAFLFRTAGEDPVPFQPVEARGRPESLRIAGQTPAALTLAVLGSERSLSKTAYQQEMAERCASQIVAWLNLGARGEAGFAGPDGAFEPLAPRHIALLVNTGREAASLRQALLRRGVRSVYLSDKETVYGTLQAREVYRWLLACTQPDDDRRLRAALSSPLLGLDVADLERLNHDETALEARVVQFKGYRDLWQRQGVLPMLRRLLRDFAVHERLLDLPADAYGQSGERILTDLLHLAELLQQASFTLDGEHALLRFLAEEMADPEGEGEGRKRRLESDADLVQVVTVHKAKGLEYPLVFVPFVCATRPVEDDDLPMTWHDAAGRLRLALTADAALRARADRDRLGEDIRKLYVALTRARHLTWLGLAHLDHHADSAVAHLLDCADRTASTLPAALADFARAAPDIAVIDAPPASTDIFAPRGGSTAGVQARRPRRPARERWGISSYSQLPLAAHERSDEALDETPQQANLLEGARERAASADLERPAQAVHRFPKGAAAGTFLHTLLEWILRQGGGAILRDPDRLRAKVAELCDSHGWQGWQGALVDWLQRLLTTPLPLAGTTLRLADLQQARPELEFWFAAHEVDLARLDALVTRHTLDGQPRPPLAAETLNGMLKGFIDLVFEHAGRYYVADYKSNWLGPTDAAYTPAAMAEAIAAHRYDLQYALYLLALHRLLKARLPDYDYDRHLGGAVYLFLRGIEAPGAGVHFARPERALIERLDHLFAGQTEPAP